MPIPIRRTASLAAASITLLVACCAAGCSKDDGPTAPRTGRLAGRLDDGFRAPVANATVHAWPLAAGVQVPSDSTSVLLRRTESDTNGAFDFGELPAGSWVVVAGFGAVIAAADTVTLPAASLVLSLQPAATIAGHVQLGALPGAGGVRVLTALPAPSVLSEPDGRWVMDGLPPGRWPVRFTMDGFRDTVVSVGPVAPGDTTDVPTVVLQPLAP